MDIYLTSLYIFYFQIIHIFPKQSKDCRIFGMSFEKQNTVYQNLKILTPTERKEKVSIHLSSKVKLFHQIILSLFQADTVAKISERNKQLEDACRLRQNCLLKSASFNHLLGLHISADTEAKFLLHITNSKMKISTKSVRAMEKDFIELDLRPYMWTFAEFIFQAEIEIDCETEHDTIDLLILFCVSLHQRYPDSQNYSGFASEVLKAWKRILPLEKDDKVRYYFISISLEVQSNIFL